MKIFKCSYEWRGGYGAYQQYEYVVVTSCGSAALGLCLEAQPDTKAADWEIKEINVSQEEAHFISSDGN